MKNPNGYGSVSKLSGKRRKPWRVRRTKCWVYTDKVTGETISHIPDDCSVYERLTDGTLRFTGKQVFEVIGYYTTRQEAMIALANYNKDPYDLNTMTLAKLYDEWSNTFYPTTSESNITVNRAAWKVCAPISNMKIGEIKLHHIQKMLDDSGKNEPTAIKVKTLLGMMYEFAVKHECINEDRRKMISHIDTKKYGNPGAVERKIFTTEEIEFLWEHCDTDIASVTLILIYSGVRIGELLNLKKEDIHLEERWFDVKASKTDSGIRDVPIAEKIVPLFDKFLSGKSPYFLVNKKNNRLTYPSFKNYWKGMIDLLNNSHTPHDTRHTTVSLLTNAGVDARIIKKIVGHKSNDITESVYTHIDISVKQEAINKI